jgi:hypothetical protein
MKSLGLIVLLPALIGPFGASAAECLAKGEVTLDKNLTADWHRLKVEVASDACRPRGCAGTIDADIVEGARGSAEASDNHVLLAYEIQKGAASTRFLATRRFGAADAGEHTYSISVGDVSCVTR